MKTGFQSIKDLYKIFSLPPDCTDEEFRQAYRRLIFAHHPDLNPSNIEVATRETQEINDAYTILKDYRENPGTFSMYSTIGVSGKLRISFDFGFSFRIDLNDITRRKDSYRQAVEVFQKNPTDILAALRLIHASFEAERYKDCSELLKQSILIDASALLVKLYGSKKVSTTLIRWADQLRQINLFEQGLQILEDAYAAGVTEDTILDELRRFHYAIAQGHHTEDKRKPEPSIRITHLTRILDIGFKLDYIYRLLAEAYYETGDTINALSNLKKAYKLNPGLTGAVKISRALGFLPQKERKERSKPKRVIENYSFTHPEQIPHPSQIRIWASEGKWDQIFLFADLTLYSPGIIPGTRSTIRQIAASLGDCPDAKAKDLLNALLPSVYWDVRGACESSLKRWGMGNIPQTVSEPIEHDQTDVEKVYWDMLVFETYHPANDDKYITVINYLATRVLSSNDPDEVLSALRKMTRWLELLGLGEMTQWFRELVRHEAPGTPYVDDHDRTNYLQNVQLSENIQTNIYPTLENLKSCAPSKLTQVLNSRKFLKKSAKPSRSKNLIVGPSGK